MKNAILYLLLFSYATIILKPMLPSFADVVAHIFWYSEHMATVHYENGKYHVHDEYADAAKKDNASKDNKGVKLEDSSKEHLIINKNYPISNPLKFMKNNFAIFSSRLSGSALKNDYPPPRA
jgi:hypothetical protein